MVRKHRKEGLQVSIYTPPLYLYTWVDPARCEQRGEVL